MQGFSFVRDVYGWLAPAFLFAVAVACMFFLDISALVIIVLPFICVFLLTLVAAYCILGRQAQSAPTAEERVLGRLFALAEDGGEITAQELMTEAAGDGEASEASEAGLDDTLHALSEVALLSFFWNARTGRITVPCLAQAVTHCPECAADIPPGAARGQCKNCRIYFVQSRRGDRPCV